MDWKGQHRHDLTRRICISYYFYVCCRSKGIGSKKHFFKASNNTTCHGGAEEQHLAAIIASRMSKGRVDFAPFDKGRQFD